MLSLSTSMPHPVWLWDILQAFVCSEFDLLRDANIISPHELGLPPNVLWRLRKPLCDLQEIGLWRYETYRKYYEKALRM